MKSAHTLMKLHERAGHVLYMISRAERIASDKNNNIANLNTNKKLLWYKDREMIDHEARLANKYQSIANYLRSRYASIIDKITQ